MLLKQMGGIAADITLIMKALIELGKPAVTSKVNEIKWTLLVQEAAYRNDRVNALIGLYHLADTHGIICIKDELRQII